MGAPASRSARSRRTGPELAETPAIRVRMTFQHWVDNGAEFSALAVQALAIIILVFGSLQAFISSARAMFRPLSAVQKPFIWLRYAEWLSAGLTFQMAADLIDTSISPSWDHLGKLALIAVIRTGLSLSLEHDTETVRKRMSP
jgi:uncharacterized membrane protein